MVLGNGLRGATRQHDARADAARAHDPIAARAAYERLTASLATVRAWGEYLAQQLAATRARVREQERVVAAIRRLTPGEREAARRRAEREVRHLRCRARRRTGGRVDHERRRHGEDLHFVARDLERNRLLLPIPNAQAFRQAMLDQGWLIAPGALFHAGRKPSTLMRINFATTQDAAFWKVFDRLRTVG